MFEVLAKAATDNFCKTICADILTQQERILLERIFAVKFLTQINSFLTRFTQLILQKLCLMITSKTLDMIYLMLQNYAYSSVLADITDYTYPYTLPSVSLPVFGADADFLTEPGYNIVECFGAGNNVKGSR